jgi:hypothetical protein
MMSLISMGRKPDGGAHNVVRLDVDASVVDDGMTGSVVRGWY